MTNRKSYCGKPFPAAGGGVRKGWIFAAICLLSLILATGAAQAQNRTLTVFYEGTDHELHVYRIWGKKPGKTLLLIGGIQGDEPGGFLSVDHYADFSLIKGNLIVVPRANFQSILLNRRKINEDMNRKFAEDRNENYEAKIVQILKQLIHESDCLLNLHDGSGFYAGTWISDQRNPSRFGQSIIADADTYVAPDTGRTLYLGDIARSVCEVINGQIEDPDLHFHFNNHRTREEDSPNKEQRKSATFYALIQAGIPAYGVETSKSLPLEDKVRHHNFAINAFMDWLDIVPENPGLNLDPPALHYLVVSVNDSLPVAVKDNQVLRVAAGDTICISHIEANYERGLSADVLGLGAVNDFRRNIRVDRPTRIVVRKDFIPCGSVYLELGPGRLPTAAVSERGEAVSSMLVFRMKINGVESVFPNHGRARLIRGDTLQIVDVLSGRIEPEEVTVNFKGFVGNLENNTGEDRGYVIDTARDLWPRYSIDKKGKTYPIVVTCGEQTVGDLYVELTEPELKYLVFRKADGALVCAAPDQAAEIDPDAPIELVDIRTNMPAEAGLEAFLSRHGKNRQPLPMNLPVTMGKRLPGADRIELMYNRLLIGTIPLASAAAAGKKMEPETAEAGILRPPAGRDNPGNNS
ncbi:MAG: succinylglutamate desuccinylase/aspartoacylase family protein [Desulfobacterales bacterium]|nr:succinylglutamate desuccinylase/aspartoacylase family protein [Desulfobacterales bacterium]